LTFYRASYAKHGISCHRVSVCPFVCLCVRPPVTSRSCTQVAKPRITQITPYDSPGTLVYLRKNIREIPTRSPPTGARNRGGVASNRRFSTNISLYLRNGTR